MVLSPSLCNGQDCTGIMDIQTELVGRQKYMILEHECTCKQTNGWYFGPRWKTIMRISASSQFTANTAWHIRMF